MSWGNLAKLIVAFLAMVAIILGAVAASFWIDENL